MQPENIRLYGTAGDSIVDGVGLRYSVFVQGCPHVCPGCHNPESQAFKGGYLANIDNLVKEISANKLINGVTLSGGEPLAQSKASLALAKKLKAHDFNLWLYTGYLFEDIMAGQVDSDAQELIALCDVVVDGPFVEALQSYELKWRGSSNQRVIDVARTLEVGEVVVWEGDESREDQPKPPPSW
ncbi:MAG: anaerobic ribonucleoside-triphosphate reductase activating protein [Eggerthellaceae bacterium]|nr:anaerobic ribonucleoside-triphosphate reductase activating protein [Eggerthellaceae bacterium]